MPKFSTLILSALLVVTPFAVAAEPKLVRIEVHGPLDHPQAATRASQTLWVIPGRPPHGADGAILTLSGLIVDFG